MSDIAFASPGHNEPPEDANPLVDRLNADHDGLLDRANDLVAALGRAPLEVDEDTAGTMADFIKQIAGCMKDLDKTRVGEKEPYLAGGRAVDAFFKVPADRLAQVKKEAEKRLSVYQRRKAEEERRAREEEARRQRQAEADARRRAEEAAASAKTDADLDDAVAAEREVEKAHAEAAKANREAAASEAELSRTRGSGAVASLQTFWDFENLNRDTVDLEPLRQHLPQAAIEQAVRSFIRAGGRNLRGVSIFQNTRTSVR
jgi:hypothetical protein